MFGGLTIKSLVLHATKRTFEFLWTWGLNTHGQLGIGDTKPRSFPVRVSLETDWRSINSGSNHTLGLKAFGSLWAWGLNNHGQLGTNDTVSRSTPTQIGNTTNWIDLFSGLNQENTGFQGNHSVGVRIGRDVELWAWGRNNYGQLGDRTSISKSSPVLVFSEPSEGDWGDTNPDTWPVRVGVGENHTVAIRGGFSFNGGSLWAWGSNRYGQLGLGDTIQRSQPIRVGSGANYNGNGWLAVACGKGHTVAIKNRGGEGSVGLTTGSLWTWGNNDNGQLGTGNRTSRSTPGQIGGFTDWAKISAGRYQTVGIRANGTLWGFGRNYGSSPVQIGFQTDWVAVSCGNNHTIGIRKQGNNYSFWAWGRNYSGVFGVGSATECEFPLQITAASATGGDWLLVDTGVRSVFALKNNRTLWAWGQETASGQLGLGTWFVNRSIPTSIGSDTDWMEVSSGGYHTVALKTNGTMWSWGGNSNGRLGLGDTTPRSSPVQVGTGTTGDWWKVKSGDGFTIALKSSGTLWAWGENYDGQLGLGDRTNRSSPVQVGTGTTGSWIAISAWGDRTFAIKSLGSTGSTSGTLWAWGQNFGRLGLGNYTDRSSPVQVGSDTDWCAINTMVGHTLALKTNGTLWAWGSNNYGQLGLGNTTEHSSPVQVGTGITGDWVFIDRNKSLTSSMAIKRNGTLWAWGNNLKGQLALGTFDNVSSPVQVVSTNPNVWGMLSCGTDFSLGRKPNGTIWCWGDRSFGRGGGIRVVESSLTSPILIGGTGSTSLGWNNSKIQSVGGLHNAVVR